MLFFLESKPFCVFSLIFLLLKPLLLLLISIKIKPSIILLSLESKSFFLFMFVFIILLRLILFDEAGLLLVIFWLVVAKFCGRVFNFLLDCIQMASDHFRISVLVIKSLNKVIELIFGMLISFAINILKLLLILNFVGLQVADSNILGMNISHNVWSIWLGLSIVSSIFLVLQKMEFTFTLDL